MSLLSRWLLDNDHDEEGMVVIANLYGEGDLLNDKARQEYREIKMNVLVQRQEGERSYSDMFHRYRKRVLIAMSAQALAQLNGINVISYYAPLVFESVGISSAAVQICPHELYPEAKSPILTDADAYLL